jgi:hypothetical protein
LEKSKTISALAATLGVSRATCKRWLRRGAPGREADGLFNPGLVAAWAAANIDSMQRRKPRPPNPSETLPAGANPEGAPAPAPTPPPALGVEGRYLEARAAEKEARAALAALQLKISSGEFISREANEERTLAIIAVFKRGLLGLENPLAQRLPGLSEKDIRVVFRTLARELLERLSKM